MLLIVTPRDVVQIELTASESSFELSDDDCKSMEKAMSCFNEHECTGSFGHLFLKALCTEGGCSEDECESASAVAVSALVLAASLAALVL